MDLQSVDFVDSVSRPSNCMEFRGFLLENVTTSCKDSVQVDYL